MLSCRISWFVSGDQSDRGMERTLPWSAQVKGWIESGILFAEGTSCLFARHGPCMKSSSASSMDVMGSKRAS